MNSPSFFPFHHHHSPWQIDRQLENPPEGEMSLGPSCKFCFVLFWIPPNSNPMQMSPKSTLPHCKELPTSTGVDHVLGDPAKPNWWVPKVQDQRMTAGLFAIVNILHLVGQLLLSQWATDRSLRKYMQSKTHQSPSPYIESSQKDFAQDDTTWMLTATIGKRPNASNA